MFRTDGKRPDAFTLIPGSKGKCLVWDAACRDMTPPPADTSPQLLTNPEQRLQWQSQGSASSTQPCLLIIPPDLSRWSLWDPLEKMPSTRSRNWEADSKLSPARQEPRHSFSRESALPFKEGTPQVSAPPSPNRQDWRKSNI